MNRRDFIKQLGLSSLVIGSGPVFASNTSLILPDTEHRTLKIKNLHTGEKINATYWENGEYLIDGLAEVYFIMRDHRANKVTAIDLDLLNNLHQVQHTLETNKEIYLISGFRSPETNATLRRQREGVAKHSLHMQGQAMDFRIPGISNKHINKAARSSISGGVGYYRKSGFIHLDTGRKRHWIG